MKALFVTGTDTGVGKTVITGLLARYLLEKGHTVATQKWIQTGAKGPMGDISIHLKIMGKRNKDYKRYIEYMIPYSLKIAASPHLAASLEKRIIAKRKIKKYLDYLSKHFDFVIIEGTGGALVPFNRKELLIDIVREMSLPSVIIAENKLGAINHTLLTIEALKKRKVRILGIIFNNRQGGSSKKILEDNPKIIKSITRENTLGVMPRIKNKKRLYKKFIPIGERIYKLIEAIGG